MDGKIALARFLLFASFAFVLFAGITHAEYQACTSITCDPEVPGFCPDYCSGPAGTCISGSMNCGSIICQPNIGQGCASLPCCTQAPYNLECASGTCQHRITPCNMSGGGCSSLSNCCTGQTPPLFCDTLNINPPPAPPTSCKSCVGELQNCSASVPCCQATPSLYCDWSNPVGGNSLCKGCQKKGDSCNPLSSGIKCCEGLLCSNTTNTCEPRTIYICAGEKFNDIWYLTLIAGIGMSCLIALVYMFGEYFNSARAITWAKDEALQLFITLVIVVVLLFLISTFCTMNVKEAATMYYYTPETYKGGNQVLNLYEAAALYLEDAAGFAKHNIAALRFNSAAYEIRTSYTEFDCDAICWLSMASSNVAIHSGETMELAVTNNLLSTATVSYLSLLFQYFTLFYIVNGLFMVFLPLAIVIRSLPFMRSFGGALIGIFVALYFFYPLMLVADAVVAPTMLVGLGHPQMIDRDGEGCSGSIIFQSDYGGVDCFTSVSGNGVRYEQNLGDGGVHESDLPAPSPVASLIQPNILIFLVAVFLPALNFIVIAALAHDLTKFLGEDADISRLGQMV